MEEGTITISFHSCFGLGARLCLGRAAQITALNGTQTSKECGGWPASWRCGIALKALRRDDEMGSLQGNVATPGAAVTDGSLLAPFVAATS